MKHLLFSCLSLLLIFSCSENSISNTSGILPDATGGADEIMIFMNDVFLNDSLTNGIKKAMIEPYKILPQPEARFSFVSVGYSKVNMILKRFINPIYIITKSEKSQLATDIKSILTKEEIKTINQVESTILFKKNIWASNQSVTIIVVSSEKEILNTLKKYKLKINNFYDNSNLKFYSKLVYIDGVNKSLNKQFKEYHGIQLDIPSGYVLAKNEKNMVLLRKDNEKSTMFLAFDVIDYNAEIPINNLGIEKFNQIGKLIDGEKENSYVVADTTLGFNLEKIEEDDLIKFENGGLWIMENDYVGGGPFVNQYIIDNKNNRIIYLSGMVYGPAEKKKKKLMRQFEAIFNTLIIE